MCIRDRIGTPALTTRGMAAKEMVTIADWIAEILDSPGEQQARTRVKNLVRELCEDFPLYPELTLT